MTTYLHRSTLSRVQQFLQLLHVTPADVRSALSISSNAIQQVTVTLTNDQIKAIPTTPAIILPATQVSGYSTPITRIPIVLGATVALSLVAGYTNVGNTVNETGLAFALGSDQSQDASIWLQSSGFLNGSPGVYAGFFPPFAYPVGAFFRGNGIVQTNRTDNVQDNALVLAAANSLGNYTGGHASNTLKVSLLYTIFDV